MLLTVADEDELATFSQIIVGDDAITDAVGLNGANEEQFTLGGGEQVGDVQDARGFPVANVANRRIGGASGGNGRTIHFCNLFKRKRVRV